MSRVLFLDRDGVLMADRGYVFREDDVELLPGVGVALRLMRQEGWKLALVSNQSGVGRAWISEAAHIAVDARLRSLLAAEGIALDAVAYCLHAPTDGCLCRKPRPGLLLQAGAQLGAWMPDSWMVGDRPSDLEAGRAAGCGNVALVTPDCPLVALVGRILSACST